MDKYEKQYGNLCAKCKSSSCCLINNTSSINCYDIVRLSIGLGISVKEFLLKYTVDWFADYNYEKSKKALITQTEKGHPRDLTWIAHKTPSMFGVNCCTFLNWSKKDNSMRCSIYDFRPDVCRDWHTPDCDDSNVVFAMNDKLIEKEMKPYFKSTEALLEYIEELKQGNDYVKYDITKYQRPIEEKLAELLKELTKQKYSYDFGFKFNPPKYKSKLKFSDFKCTDDDGYNNHYYPNLLKECEFSNGMPFHSDLGQRAYKAYWFLESVVKLPSYLNELDAKQQKEIKKHYEIIRTHIMRLYAGVGNLADLYKKNGIDISKIIYSGKKASICKSQNDDGFWLVKDKNLKDEIYKTIKTSINNLIFLAYWMRY